MEKLPLTNKVRSHLAQVLQKELKTCAARLGGPARKLAGTIRFLVPEVLSLEC